ncbi:hypothetical protein B0H16DRAFT_1651548 [Mycena metata]|uniref:Uncharacterized protein n=1 Tax=Mycena metata TaxID=1033252 RepID=A0AAD7DKB3_9AGAR|nr:hypothetical protein B0H16DRAFT_1651548 [Mycena metata]
MSATTNANGKRPRTDSNSPVATPATSVPASQHASNDTLSSKATPWHENVKDIASHLHPPKKVLAGFITRYDEAKSGFEKSFRSFKLAQSAKAKFAAESDGDTVPDSIKRSLKGPVYVFPASILDEATTELAQSVAEYDASMFIVAKAVVAHHLLRLSTAVKLLQEVTDISTREEVLNASLMEYSIAVLQSAGLTDHTRWNTYISRVVQAFRTELTDVKIDVGASLDQEKADKAARDAKVKSANADVEMADATETLREAVKAEVARQAKNLAPAPTKDSASTSAPGKRQKTSNAVASSSKPANANADPSKSKSKVKRQPQARKNPKKSDASKNGKDERGKGKGRDAGKGKGKAKATESDSK